MSQGGSELDNLRKAAVEWAAGGRGQSIVNAAATALGAGVDSPSLRMLAGAPHAFADEEASEFAPHAFRELGLDISERLSSQAYVDAARARARGFLAGVTSARELTAQLAGFYIAAGYPLELQGWIGLDDYYAMVRNGVVDGSESQIDSAVERLAEDLISERESELATPDSLFVAATPDPARRRPPWLDRIFRRR